MASPARRPRSSAPNATGAVAGCPLIDTIRSPTARPRLFEHRVGTKANDRRRLAVVGQHDACAEIRTPAQRLVIRRRDALLQPRQTASATTSRTNEPTTIPASDR
jgi:hypothetical protein